MTQLYCPRCSKRFQADSMASFCSNCGTKLQAVSEEKKNYYDMGALLCDVRDEYGIEVFTNASRVKGLLKDKAPHLKKEIQLFSIALDSPAFRDCYSRRGDSSVMTELKKGKFKLMDEKFIGEENADRIVGWYCVLLDIRSDKNEDPPRTVEPCPSAAPEPEPSIAENPVPVVSVQPQHPEPTPRPTPVQPLPEPTPRPAPVQPLPEPTPRPTPVQPLPEPPQKNNNGFLVFYCIASFLFGGTAIMGLINESHVVKLGFTPVSATIVIAMAILAFAGCFNRNKWSKVVNMIVSVVLVFGFIAVAALLPAARA